LTKAPAYSSPSTNPFGISDVGDFSSPAFADLDADGDLDLFIGNKDGNTLVFTNTATAALGATKQIVSYTAKVADAAGNESITGPAYTGKIVATADVTYILDDHGYVSGSDNSGTYTYRGKLTSANFTDDDLVEIGGTISTSLGANDSIRIYDGSSYLGEATVSDTTWSFYDSREFLNGNIRRYEARIYDEGNYYTGRTYTIISDRIVPTTTATITNISDDFGETTGAISAPASSQITTLTFTASYDAGDVVSLVVDGVTYSHTIVIGSTSAENVYDALKLVTVNGTTLASRLSGKGVSWAANLTSNAVTLTSTADASKRALDNVHRE
jgi:hypothetical protein